MDKRNALLLNKSIKGPGETLKSWNETKTDPNSEIGQIMNDEAIAGNPYVSKAKDYTLLHQNSIDKMMQGNITPDTVLKKKIEMEKSGLLKKLMAENTFETTLMEMGAFAGGGMSSSGGSPVAPMNASPSQKPKKKFKSVSDLLNDSVKNLNGGK